MPLVLQIHASLIHQNVCTALLHSPSPDQAELTQQNHIKSPNLTATFPSTYIDSRPYFKDLAPESQLIIIWNRIYH